jgi:hypothetical protein
MSKLSSSRPCHLASLGLVTCCSRPLCLFSGGLYAFLLLVLREQVWNMNDKTVLSSAWVMICDKFRVRQELRRRHIGKFFGDIFEGKVSIMNYIFSSNLDHLHSSKNLLKESSSLSVPSCLQNYSSTHGSLPPTRPDLPHSKGALQITAHEDHTRCTFRYRDDGTRETARYFVLKLAA